MIGQSSDAAERSAHVTRGPAAEGAALHPILERKNEAGQTTGQLRVVVELREENARLRAALHRISLGSQNSGATKEDLGREARNALDPAPTEDATFLARMLGAAETGERVTEDDVARLRRLANWADAAPPPSWNGTLDKGETRRAVEAARTAMAEAHHA